MGDVHKEIYQTFNLTMWFSQGEKCTKLNTSNMCNFQSNYYNKHQLRYKPI
jgi:hypothetical protein